MKYRKKPVVIDALQWTCTNHREMFDFLTDYQCTDQYISAEGKNFYQLWQSTTSIGYNPVIPHGRG